MTPDDYGRLYDEARDERPFSNSDEGYGWIANWCDRCVHERPARTGMDSRGCPLLLVALTDRTPIQWLDGPRDENGTYSLADQYSCVEFRDENSGSGPDPQPIPDPPGQLCLMPREEYEGVRMLKGSAENPRVNSRCTATEKV